MTQSCYHTSGDDMGRSNDPTAPVSWVPAGKYDRPPSTEPNLSNPNNDSSEVRPNHLGLKLHTVNTVWGLASAVRRRSRRRRRLHPENKLRVRQSRAGRSAGDPAAVSSRFLRYPWLKQRLERPGLVASLPEHTGASDMRLGCCRHLSYSLLRSKKRNIRGIQHES